MDTAFRCGFIAIVGRPNVGKSTLMNHLIGQKISITSQKAQTTRQKIQGIYTDERAQWIFVDTPGFQTRHRNALNDRLNKNVTEALNGVDVVLYVLEAGQFTEADAQVLALLPSGQPVILVVNKLDRIKNRHELSDFLEAMRPKHDFVHAEAVSARHGHRLSELLEAIRPLLPEGPPLFSDDMVTDKSSRFLAAEIVREKLFRYLGEELPYALNVEVEQFRVEDSGLHRLYVAIIVEKESQKGMVIGKGGDKLKKISTEARLDMERLFDAKVFLQVFVKVKSGWADDARFLHELGL